MVHISAANVAYNLFEILSIGLIEVKHSSGDALTISTFGKHLIDILVNSIDSKPVVQLIV